MPLSPWNVLHAVAVLSWDCVGLYLTSTRVFLLQILDEGGQDSPLPPPVGQVGGGYTQILVGQKAQFYKLVG